MASRSFTSLQDLRCAPSSIGSIPTKRAKFMQTLSMRMELNTIDGLRLFRMKRSLMETRVEGLDDTEQCLDSSDGVTAEAVL